MASGDVIDVGDLPRTMRQGRPTRPPAPPLRGAVERASQFPPANLAGTGVSIERTLAQQREQWLDPLERQYLQALLTPSPSTVCSRSGGSRSVAA